MQIVSELIDIPNNGNPSTEYIEKEYGGQISGEEIMFLAIHIKRVCMTD